MKRVLLPRLKKSQKQIENKEAEKPQTSSENETLTVSKFKELSNTLNDPESLFFSVAFGATYALKVTISQSGGYSWHDGVFNHALWIYTLASFVMFSLPLLAAFIYFFEKDLIKRTLGETMNLFLLFILILFPYATFHTAEFLIEVTGASPLPGNILAGNCTLPTAIAQCEPYPYFNEIGWILAYTEGILIIILLGLISTRKNPSASAPISSRIAHPPRKHRSVIFAIISVIAVSFFIVWINAKPININFESIQVIYYDQQSHYFTGPNDILVIQGTSGSPNDILHFNMSIYNSDNSIHYINGMLPITPNFRIVSPLFNPPFPLPAHSNRTIVVHVTTTVKNFNEVLLLNLTTT